MKILFQGSLGAYSHLAALEIYPDAKLYHVKLLMNVLVELIKILKLEL